MKTAYIIFSNAKPHGHKAVLNLVIDFAGSMNWIIIYPLNPEDL